jgi:phage-related protein (TIGR01555 family)
MTHRKRISKINTAPKIKANNFSSVIQTASNFALQEKNQLSMSDTTALSLRDQFITLDRNFLDKIYIVHGIVQRFIDMPVDDGYRGWVKLRSNELTPQEIEKVDQYINEVNFPETFKQALKWMRLFGGSALLIDVDGDGYQTELNINSINENTNLHFIVADNWELANAMNSELTRPADSLPSANADLFLYYGQEVDRSRVVLFKGKDAPSLSAKSLRGWGLSEIEAILRSFNLYVKNNNVLFELLDEAKVDIFGIKDLYDSFLSREAEQALTNRLTAMNKQKNYLNSVAIDSDDTFTSKQLNFSGLSDLMKMFQQGLAADLGIPETKLYGKSSAGFNAGEDEIENYNAMIESDIRRCNQNQLILCYKIICQKVLGRIPDDLQIEYEPLRIMSSEQEENVKNQIFNRTMESYKAGLIDEKAFLDSVNADNLLPIQVSEEDLGEEQIDGIAIE